MSDLAIEKARLDEVRGHHGNRLERHWAALKDKDVRGTLFRDAISDMVSSWRPARMVAGLVGNGSLTSAIGSAVFRRGGLSKRLLSFGATLILPYLLNKAGDMNLTELKDKARTMIGVIRDLMGRHQSSDELDQDDRT